MKFFISVDAGGSPSFSITYYRLNLHHHFNSFQCLHFVSESVLVTLLLRVDYGS